MGVGGSVCGENPGVQTLISRKQKILKIKLLDVFFLFLLSCFILFSTIFVKKWI